MVFNETLRIEAPTNVSGLITLTEDNLTLGGYKYLKDTPMHINLVSIHHNKKEWINPGKFIPERFDPQSKYSLTPSG
jgi:cytochrome P450